MSKRQLRPAEVLHSPAWTQMAITPVGRMLSDRYVLLHLDRIRLDSDYVPRSPGTYTLRAKGPFTHQNSERPRSNFAAVWEQHALAATGPEVTWTPWRYDSDYGNGQSRIGTYGDGAVVAAEAHVVENLLAYSYVIRMSSVEPPGAAAPMLVIVDAGDARPVGLIAAHRLDAVVEGLADLRALLDGAS